ncbi:hypothetical protein [Marinobacter adhaerens]|uniref:hypothetical protein n=1 Tax=Marinobacter adhaerens TaxID=1033846 RepID=UPI003D29E6CE
MFETSYYGPTAWHPERDSSPRHRGQLDQRSRGFRFQWEAGQKLSKEYVPNMVPGDFLETWLPGQDEDTNWYVEEGRGEERKRVPMAWINQESIRWATLPGSSWRWLLLKVFAKFTLILGGVGIFLASVAVTLLLDVSAEEKRQLFQEGFLPIVVYGGGGCALIWGGGSLIEHLFPSWIYKAPKGPLWEFNRRTGLVTAFRNPKRQRDAGQIAWQSPFADFDGYVHTGPTHQGLPLYYGAMVHRFREEALPLTDFQAASSNDEDHKALWNFWLQYMDSTAPLPDIPLFEPHRHKDPVTAEHDKRIGRNPRYWRDMDEATYKQKTDEMYKRCLKVFSFASR